MCWMCDHEARSKFTIDYQNSLISNLRVHAGAAGKALDGLLFTGHDLVLPTVGALPALILTVDNVAGDTGTTSTISVGQSLISTIDTIGDQDFFKVELTAGKTYEIGQYLTNSGPNGVPLADAYLELYDSAGNLIVIADGGGPNTPSGLDALLSYTAQYTGTYFINARAYDDNPLNGSTGDFVGDYQLFVREASPFAYRPYYDTESPLYAIDWGSQVDGSSRNPDGQEGERVTGNAHTGYAWNPYGIEGKNIIYYYFAKQGEVFISQDPANPGLENMVASGFRDWEKNAYEMALGEYEKVADIIYIEVDNRNEADFIFITYDGTPNFGVLGRMSPPDEQNEGQTEFNRNGPGWNEAALKPGGFSFQTLMHELGHGHGLAHPHDGGGRSGVMRGVFEESVFDYSTGHYNLNQGIYTIMSYEDGWRPRSEATADMDGDGVNDTQGLRPDGHGAPPTSSTYGWMGSLGAFDIAVLQDKYGVNEEWATGNDVYVLKDQNTDGTFYQSIWDAGGNDTMIYGGARAAVIDLRPASLRYDFGGGGFVSYAFGIHGGFTIANGVTIENAVGGFGDDVLIGNDAANYLHGRAGADRMEGGKGNDIYVVDNLGDTVIEAMGAGDDFVFTSISWALTPGQEVETLSTSFHAGTEAISLTGNYFAQHLIGNNGDNYLNGAGGADRMEGLGGNDHYIVDDAGDVVIEAAGGGNDTVSTWASWTLGAGQEVETLSTAVHSDTTAIDLTGNEYAQTVLGNFGDNWLDGKGGSDTLRGFSGADTFAFTTALGAGNVDTILDFETGIDKIALDDAVFAGLAAGALAAGAFRVGTSAQDADDRIIYDSATGALFFDADGAGGAAAIQFATLQAGLNLTASDFTVI